jgi:hypothetical protein
MTQMYEVVVKATGEVRDADGNLVDSEPIEVTMHLTADQVRQFTEGEPS